MSRSKYTPEMKHTVVQAYLSGEGSYRYLAQKYGIPGKTIRFYVQKYKAQGETSFAEKKGNARYTAELKKQCVLAVLCGEGSEYEIAAKYNISSHSVLRRWIQRYNANKELRDYDPKREVYMADARRKTTLAERKEIVEYCISHNRDYKSAASHYDVSYSQVYTWVKKYIASGEAGLDDRRGHRKTDEEVDELERLRRENARLKRQLEERDMVVELLKKVKELEGM